MNFSPVQQNSFGCFGYYGKKGPTLQDVFPEYRDCYKDSDVIYIKNKEGKFQPIVVGNLRTLAIQEQHPRYRYSLGGSDVIDLGCTANDARKEFAQEEENVSKKREIPKIINYIV